MCGACVVTTHARVALAHMGHQHPHSIGSDGRTVLPHGMPVWADDAVSPTLLVERRRGCVGGKTRMRAHRGHWHSHFRGIYGWFASGILCCDWDLSNNVGLYEPVVFFPLESFLRFGFLHFLDCCEKDGSPTGNARSAPAAELQILGKYNEHTQYWLPCLGFHAGIGWSKCLKLGKATSSTLQVCNPGGEQSARIFSHYHVLFVAVVVVFENQHHKASTKCVIVCGAHGGFLLTGPSALSGCFAHFQMVARCCHTWSSWDSDSKPAVLFPPVLFDTCSSIFNLKACIARLLSASQERPPSRFTLGIKHWRRAIIPAGVRPH
ncbi:hypothetical protein Pelo_17230 [Pelomyxa schiedti]|nr:hypothetical protein Pelo_17230 [Pelomyxa schiedti]